MAPLGPDYAMPHSQFVSLDEAAEYLGVTPRSIRRYIAEGRLPGYRLGKKQIRVRTSDVEALLTPIPTVAS